MKKLIVLKNCLLIGLCLLFSNLILAQQNSYWQQKVDYKIDVTLNDTTKELNGYIEFNYFNNAPDTLKFIWIHLWPNAYKNDRTAFCDQLLENGNTSFYFSDEDKRGYINKINFKVNELSATITDHPVHQDIVKLILPSPLLPHTSVKIETPFHVKLPYNFSRGGFIDSAFQITQWYPKPAVYDKMGWHEMPYLDQGEFYSEYGSFEIKINVPEKYKVAATGILKNESISGQIKSYHYYQENIHDFAWFAAKDFIVEHDTFHLSNRIIDVYAYHYPSKTNHWKNGIRYIKNAISTKSKWIGEYPYDIVSVVESPREGGGGMEYPTITLIDKTDDNKELDNLINHEVGHNWFYGILGTNERNFPWMDEGINSYYDKRYKSEFYPNYKNEPTLKGKIPFNFEDLLTTSISRIHKDQSINTPSDKFSALNYELIAYNKTAMWMQLLERQLTQPLFDNVMKAYFSEWKFKHPYPEDFKSIAERISHSDFTSEFSLLNHTGELYSKQKKDIRFTGFFSLKNTDKHNYISIMPALGYNNYDKLMIGGLIHNYGLPTNKLQFVLVPLYAAGTKELNGIGRFSYTIYPGSKDQRLVISLNTASFTNNQFTDSTGKKNYLRFRKIVPGLKYVFANNNPRSTANKYIQWKTFLFNETSLNFFRDTVQQAYIISYPIVKRYLNQLQLVYEENRSLYPYKAIFSAEQGKGFLKFGFTGNYFFNYKKEGGLTMRFYAGKFIYTGERSYKTQYETDRYHLNLSGANGFEDYTYSNYFAGRNEFEGWKSQQMMIKEGAFKVRTELLSSKIGKTDDWLSTLSLTTTIPKNINPLSVLPMKLPLSIFFDLGTYAEAWKTNPPTDRFLYDAGFQLSLFKNIVNVYCPILYSKPFGDYIKSTITEKRFLKSISFNIDIQKISLRTFIPQITF